MWVCSHAHIGADAQAQGIVPGKPGRGPRGTKHYWSTWRVAGSHLSLRLVTYRRDRTQRSLLTTTRTKEGRPPPFRAARATKAAGHPRHTTTSAIWAPRTARHPLRRPSPNKTLHCLPGNRVAVRAITASRTATKVRTLRRPPRNRARRRPPRNRAAGQTRRARRAATRDR